MSTYIKFTDEQLELANRVNLIELLRRSGYKLTRAGSEYNWESPTGKVSIRGNSWYHQYEKIGGKAIGFLTRFHDMEFKEAVLFLLSEQGLRVEAEETPREKKPFELPPKNHDLRRVYAYLINTRFLDREIVDHFVREGLIYEDAQYHNAVFVGLDEEGVPRHASKRGTGRKSTYKGNAAESDDRYCFRYTGTGNEVYVFESPIDMLAYLSLHKENWQENSYITLCSAASEAAVHFLKTNPQIDTVYSCLDHDKAGIEGYYRLAEEAGKVGEYRVEIKQPQVKDWNEQLKAMNGITPLPAQEHPGIIRMKELCLELAGDWIDDPYPKYPMAEMSDKYNKLKRLVRSQVDQVMEQSYELSGAAFLFAKKQCATLEMKISVWEFGKLLFSKYAPHHDHCAYRSRIVDIGERLIELKKACGYDEVRTKHQMKEIIDRSLILAVDCLRLCMYMEQHPPEQNQRSRNGANSKLYEEIEEEPCVEMSM